MGLFLLGCVNILLGTALLIGGILASSLWTWLAHSYMCFIWGGVLVIIVGCFTTRIADQKNQHLAEMATTLTLHLVGLVVCILMLNHQIIHIVALIGSKNNSEFWSPLINHVGEDVNEEASSLLDEKFQDLYSARSPMTMVAAVDISLLISVLLTTLTFIIGSVKVKTCISYRAGEDALIRSWAKPIVSSSLDNMIANRSKVMESPINAYNQNPRSRYENLTIHPVTYAESVTDGPRDNPNFHTGSDIYNPSEVPMSTPHNQHGAQQQDRREAMMHRQHMNDYMQRHGRNPQMSVNEMRYGETYTSERAYHRTPDLVNHMGSRY